MSTRQSLIAPVPPPKAVLPPLKASPPLGRKPTALKPLGPVSPTLTPAFAPAGETDNGGLAKDVALQPLPPTSHGQGLSLTKLTPEVQPKTTTGGDAFKQAEQQLLALTPADTSGRSTLLKRLAASDQAMAWQLYQKMRALDVATFFAPADPPEEGVVLPAALALRRCVSFVEGQAASVDLALLQHDFQPSGSPPQLLDALYFEHVVEIAQQTLSAAAERHAAASGGTGSAASPSGAAETTPRVAWPELVREANAVCDAVSVLAASLAGHLGTQPSALPRLERSSVLRPCASAVVEATRAHVRQITSAAIAAEKASGPQRTGWVKVLTPSGQPSYVLASCATLLASLRLHSSGAAFGVLPELDVAVCEELGAAVELYAAHVLSLADACVTVAKGLTATGRTVDGKGQAASLPPAVLAAAADRALPIACVSSVIAVRRLIEQLLAGDRVGTATSKAVPPLRWSDAACAARLGEAAKVLAEAERRASALMCDGVATVACAAALDSAAGGAFWTGAKAWRGGTRCSLPIQLCLLQLHTAKCNLDALGDNELADTLFCRTARRTLARLTQSYYREASPSEPRMTTLCRDLQLLCAFAVGQSDLGEAADGGAAPPDAASAPTAAEAAHTQAAAACAAASAAAGVGPPSVEDASLAIERRRVGQLALWLVSLLALYEAPVALLCEFVKAGGSAGGSAAAASSAASQSAAEAGSEWSLVGLDTLPRGSPAALAALRALALPAVAPPAHAPWKPGYDTEKRFMQLYVRPAVESSHPKLQEAAEAPLPEGLDWPALLLWDTFPLRDIPNLVRFALKRHPCLQPASLSVAEELSQKDPAASDLESRRELLALLSSDSY